jgi:TrmH family RNA methyltransferase
MRGAVAIVFGREDMGLSDFWKDRSDAKIRIPMAGICDSLNVSVSAAVICFEVLRQRKKIS